MFQELIAELWLTVDAVKVLGWKEARPWHEFFATFKPPELNFNNITQRVTTNLLHYRSNYVIITALIMLLRIVFSPLLLVSICICIGFFYYCFIIHNEPFIFGDIKVDGSMKITLCAVLSFIFLALTGSLENIIWGVLAAFILCGLHTVFRPRNIAARANFVYEDTKLSWFGNAGGDKHKTDAMTPDDPENPSGRDSDSGGSYDVSSSAENLSVRKRGVVIKNSSFSDAHNSSLKHD